MASARSDVFLVGWPTFEDSPPLRAGRVAHSRSTISEREKAARIELISFQLGEIDKVGPKPGEDEQLGEERQMLNFRGAGRSQGMAGHGCLGLIELSGG